MLADFDLAIPTTLDGALADLARQTDGTTVPLAGGTNLIVDMRARRARPDHVVGLDRIAELRGIHPTDDRITIGARTTVTDLLESEIIAEWAPSLRESATLFAGQMVRNTATVGGNIACGSPAADLVPPLMTLDAEVVLTSADGSRTVALDDYFVGYKADVRRPDELITEISWPRLPVRSANSFYKLARRLGDAITVTGIAVTVTTDDGRCERARIALGAVAPVVLRARAAEAVLEGRVLNDDLIDEAADLAVAACSPIDDVRASADYRRQMVRVLTRRLVRQAWAKLA